MLPWKGIKYANDEYCQRFMKEVPFMQKKLQLTKVYDHQKKSSDGSGVFEVKERELKEE